MMGAELVILLLIFNTNTFKIKKKKEKRKYPEFSWKSFKQLDE